MNEFTVKKLGEVEAFGRLCHAVLTKAEGFDVAEASVAARLGTAGESYVAGHIPSELREVFDKKVAKTTAKLEAMMELYIGDEWDNPVEVLEWTSFFTGAAAAHCALTVGATAKDDGALHAWLATAERRFLDALAEVRTSLRNLGTAKG